MKAWRGWRLWRQVAVLMLAAWLGGVALAADEFEGRYRVGPTTCTVTPVRMAFEVRWKRGNGHMLFFFREETPEGRYIFASEDKPDGRDRFEFDDRRLRSGRFVRSDGKVFEVRRLPERPDT